MYDLARNVGDHWGYHDMQFKYSVGQSIYHFSLHETIVVRPNPRHVVILGEHYPGYIFSTLNGSKKMTNVGTSSYCTLTLHSIPS
jgi:hypothetical protein